jgi:hypothetical protein
MRILAVWTTAWTLFRSEPIITFPLATGTSNFLIEYLQQGKNCGFAQGFNGTFQHGSIDDIEFRLTYGDGSFVRGPFGLQDIMIANLTVKRQQISLVDTASWGGGGLASGLLGLAYPILTSAYAKSSLNHTIDSPGHKVYDPILTSMRKQGLSPPIFSVSVNARNGSGWLAFGGVPPVNHDADFVSTPIRKVRNQKFYVPLTIEGRALT